MMRAQFEPIRGERWEYVDGNPRYKVSNKGRVYTKFNGRLVRVQEGPRTPPRVLLYVGNNRSQFFDLEELVKHHFPDA